MSFIDYKCLESLLIEGEEIANEGLIDKFKNMKQKREERKVQIRQHELERQKLLPKLEEELKKIVSSYKPKTKKVKMTPYYGIDKLDNSAYVQLFNENTILNQNDDSVYDAAQDITEDIYKLTENFANTTKKYSGFDLKADVPDNYCIYLQIV